MALFALETFILKCSGSNQAVFVPEGGRRAGGSFSEGRSVFFVPVVVSVVLIGFAARQDLAEQGFVTDGQDPHRRGNVREALHRYHSKRRFNTKLTMALTCPPLFPSEAV